MESSLHSAMTGELDAVTDAILAAGAAELQGRLPFVRSLELHYRTPYGGREDLFRLGAMLALMEHERGALFGQLEGTLRDREGGFNVGLGYRFDVSEQVQLGLNLFYDWLSEPDLQRVSAGLELRTRLLDLGANFYDAPDSSSDPDRDGSVEYALGGWDAELAGRLPVLPWLEAGARYYKWNRRFGAEDLEGQEYSLRARPISLLELSLRYDDPEQGATDWGIDVALRYEFGRSWTEQAGRLTSEQALDLQARRFERVRRQYEIRTQRMQKGQFGTVSGAGCTQQYTGTDQCTSFTVSASDQGKCVILGRATCFEIRLATGLDRAVLQALQVTGSSGDGMITLELDRDASTPAPESLTGQRGSAYAGAAPAVRITVDSVVSTGATSTCPAAGAGANGIPEDTEASGYLPAEEPYESGTTVTITRVNCGGGQVAGAGVTYTCDVSDTLPVWTTAGAAPTCEAATCPAAGAGANGIPEDTEASGYLPAEEPYESGTTVTITRVNCGGGQVAGAGVTYTCDVSDTLPVWTTAGAAPTCEAATCRSLTAPQNGTVEDRGRQIGQEAIYTCNTDYVRNGARTRTCQAGGTEAEPRIWSGLAPTCVASTTLCTEVLTAPENGTLSTQRREIGQEVQYSCNAGYRLNGNAARICQVDRIWSPDTAPICEAIPDYCPPLTIQGNLFVDDKEGKIGQEAEYSCAGGDLLNGARMRICQAGGTEAGSGIWSGLAPTCVASTTLCTEVLTAPENGTLSTQRREIGQEVQYSCNAGYRLNGNAARICQADRTWSPDTAPICEAIVATLGFRYEANSAGASSGRPVEVVGSNVGTLGAVKYSLTLTVVESEDEDKDACSAIQGKVIKYRLSKADAIRELRLFRAPPGELLGETGPYDGTFAIQQGDCRDGAVNLTYSLFPETNGESTDGERIELSILDAESSADYTVDPGSGSYHIIIVQPNPLPPESPDDPLQPPPPPSSESCGTGMGIACIGYDDDFFGNRRVFDIRCEKGEKIKESQGAIVGEDFTPSDCTCEGAGAGVTIASEDIIPRCFPACEEVLSFPENGVVHAPGQLAAPGQLVGDEAEYGCDPGYELSGISETIGSIRRCEQGEQGTAWSDPEPTCTLSDSTCPAFKDAPPLSASLAATHTKILAICPSPPTLLIQSSMSISPIAKIT